jgi:hypothetical protein
MTLLRTRLLTIVVTMLLLTACGDGGADGSSGATSPSTSRTQPAVLAPTPVVIFANPTPQTYASVGASTTSAGDGYTSIASNARLTFVSLEAANQPRLRYQASRYEIQLPGGVFNPLIHYLGLTNPTPANNFFQPSNAGLNRATFIISQSGRDGYVYSELASWSNATATGHLGTVAFGSPTPAPAIATSGTASYRGRIFGIVDITYYDGLYGGNYFSTVDGTVTLTVEFATRSIEGTLEIDDPTGTSTYPVPLTATTFLPGEDAFWGSFQTSQSGFNEFKVILTGPEASELIGSWAVPIEIDGQPHQLMGAWIAARD